MKFNFNVSPNLRQKQSTRRIMAELTIALLAVYAFSLYFYYTRYDLDRALQAVKLMAVSLLVALATESIWALVTKQKVGAFLMNSFGFVTAIILTLMCPLNITPFALGIATFFAIFFGKLLFGGFGQNIFNPAAFGRAIVFAAFAKASTDVITGATPTTIMATTYNWLPADNAVFTQLMDSIGDLGNMATGWYAGAIGETSAILLLLVGVVLAIRKVIDWRVPLIFISTVFVLGAVVGIASGMSADLWLPYAAFHVLSGGVMFGAVFMLTDPVTTPTSAPGRCIFALGCAFITMLIRLKGNLPEGVLYSILLMNMLTPMIEKALDGKQTQIMKKAVTIFAVLALFAVGTSYVLGATGEKAESSGHTAGISAQEVQR